MKFNKWWFLAVVGAALLAIPVLYAQTHQIAAVNATHNDTAAPVPIDTSPAMTIAITDFDLSTAIAKTTDATAIAGAQTLHMEKAETVPKDPDVYVALTNNDTRSSTAATSRAGPSNGICKQMT